MATRSSFYSQSTTVGTEIPAPGAAASNETNTKSSFYQDGTLYDEITQASTLLATVEAARDAALAAQTAAELAETNAETAETNAELAETNAETAETNAETAQAAAEAAQAAAAASASAASTSASNASTSASAASTSASNAATSASAASTSASNAATSATAAQTAETNAETAETNAETAATAAAASASAAATSEANAAASVTGAVKYNVAQSLSGAEQTQARSNIAAAASTHTHAISDTTGLQTALDGKASTSHTHAQADVTNLVTDLAAKAPLASPTFTGTPAAPTAAGGTNTTQIATTAYVQTELAAKAPLASPTFTGTPAAPTAAAGTNTTQLATTAFVKAAIDVVLGGVAAAGDTLAELYTLITGHTANTSNPHSVTKAQVGLGNVTDNAQVVDPGANGFVDRTASGAASARTLTGTSNRVTVTNGGGGGNPVFDTGTDVLHKNVTATVSVGYTLTPNNLGNMTNFTVNPANGNYQYGTNNAAFTLTAPASDCAVDILVTNHATTAGTITFSGFTAPSGGGGDTYATTGNNKYLLMIRRINGTSTYLWKALQ